MIHISTKYCGNGKENMKHKNENISNLLIKDAVNEKTLSWRVYNKRKGKVGGVDIKFNKSSGQQ